ncbi:MAG: UvrD-helicase domain-containing protein, partial [Myxococcota bacterium]|nr:UvrD-helicase domain-containing protein [Myxococcota bacterium]
MTDSVAEQIALQGTSLVEAGAGTGKTHTIVELFARLLIERRLRVSQILVVTYTVAAAAELRGRIRRRLLELASSPQSESDLEWLVEALRSFDQAAIFTIHGFCQRALQQHAFEIGRAFESELVSDSRALFTEVAQDFWVRELYSAQAAQVEYAGLSSASLGPRQLAQLAEQVAMRPDIEVRPARRPVPDLAVLEKEWRSAFDRVAPAWASDRDEVLEILATGAEQGQLHKGRYKRDVLQTKWRLVMDTAMREARPGIQRRFKQLPLLSTSGIANLNNQPKPVHGFFDLCDSLVRAEEGLEKGLRDWAANFRHDFVAYARTELVRRKD